MKRPQSPEDSASQTNRTATIGFRVEPHVKEAAERAAAKDRRSLSSLLEKILMEFLAAQRLLPGQDA
jgi:predicted HicB family RNase H-like nuclease